MEKKYHKDLWFIKFEKEKNFVENYKNNLNGIIRKMGFVNELRIWCREDMSPTVNSIIEDAIRVGGWIKVNSKINEDATDLEGKKFGIIIVETLIRRTGANWKK